MTKSTYQIIQTKQKDGTKGINLYKRSLRSVPRELFNHPLAEEVEWLNLACNALVYNKNGLFKNIDKVSLDWGSALSTPHSPLNLRSPSLE